MRLKIGKKLKTASLNSRFSKSKKEEYTSTQCCRNGDGGQVPPLPFYQEGQGGQYCPLHFSTIVTKQTFANLKARLSKAG